VGLSPVIGRSGNVSLLCDSISARPVSSISARAHQGETHGGIVIAEENRDAPSLYTPPEAQAGIDSVGPYRVLDDRGEGHCFVAAEQVI